MSNQTVYPFGPDGQLPGGIGIVNDLTTGGANKALSAEQGKIIGGKIGTYDDMVDDLYGVEAEVEDSVDFSSLPLFNISLDSDKFYYYSTSKNYKAFCFPVPEGAEQLVITQGSGSATYIFIAKTQVPVGTYNANVIIANYMATGCEGYSPASGNFRMKVNSSSELTIKLSASAKYIYIQHNFNDTSVDMTPASLVFSGHIRKDGKLESLANGTNGLFGGISFVSGILNNSGVVDPDNTHLVSNPIPVSVGYYLELNYPLYAIESIALYDNSGKCVNRKFFTFIPDVTSKLQNYGSVVCIPGYYVRFVLERGDGMAASVNDNIVKQFALFDDRRLKRLVPDNQKFQTFLDRIKVQTNVAWKALGKIAAVHSKLETYYDKDSVNLGLPYSDVGEYSKYVYFDVSIRTFLTALLNRRSVMYTENASSENSSSKYGITYHNWENAAGPYYGTVCSGLTGFALGFPEILTSAIYGDNMIEGETVIAKGDQSHNYYIKNGNSWEVCDAEDILDLIQPMDLITTPGHVSFISDIYLDEFGNKKFIVWSEESSSQYPTARSCPMSPGRFLARLETNAAKPDGWKICRYSDWSGATPVDDIGKLLPMDWFEYQKELSIDPDICTYAGDYVVFQIGAADDTDNNNRAFLNIHRDGDKYDTLQIFAESADETTDEPVAEIDISENSGTFIYNSTNIFADDASDKDDWIVVDLKQLPTALTHGKYKARVIKDGGDAESGFTHFQMVDVNFTITGETLASAVANYSSEEAVPFYMRIERIDGLGARINQRSIPENETSTTAIRSWSFNSTTKYCKVFFRADYGVAVKRINVYAMFNS